MKQVSLGELAIELGINKSKLAYFFSIGLLKPVDTIGKMNVFNHNETIKRLKKIEKLKAKGKKLDEIKEELK